MKVFLDANILFAVAWRPDGGCRKLIDQLQRNAISLATSQYAAHEAQRNIRKKVLKLKGSSSQEEAVLNQLLEEIVLISNRDIFALENHTTIPLKDWPIIEGAVAFGATHLLTGDKDHFGSYQHKKVYSVQIVFAADLWEQTRA